MDLSPRYYNKVKGYEGIEDGDPTTVNLEPYLCPAGYWTIGWGHVVRDAAGNQLKGNTAAMKKLAYSIYPGGISLQEAEILLINDSRSRQAALNTLLKGAKTTQGQFDAMGSLLFNIGQTRFATSSVLRKHRAGDMKGAAKAFMLWNKITNPKTKVLEYSEGLNNRRIDERTLYLSR